MLIKYQLYFDFFLKLTKGTMINFIHEMDEQYLMIKGEIAHDKTFTVPKTKVSYLRKNIKPIIRLNYLRE